MGFDKWFDKQGMIVKFLLTFFLDPIVGGIYRLSKGSILLGILWLLFGLFGIGWIIDIVSVLLHGKYKWLV